MSIIADYTKSLATSLKLTTGSAGGAQKATATDLARALSADESRQASSAYTLSLSPEAQAMLAKEQTDAVSTASDIDDHFVLTGEQQAKLTEIVAKYKDAPYTQASFEQLAQDLDDAGLSPDDLALQKKLSTFDSTTTLVDALNGKSVYGSSDPFDTSDYNDMKESYLDEVLAQWQEISTTYTPEEDSPQV